ncbi:hypothetical protein OIU76_000436 [Salix suchowensis]|nr:hypothetical protein OIU76_000436 [Salix suchowensis]
MFWHTSKLFHSAASVVVLGELLKLRTAIQMFVYSLFRSKVWMSMHFTYHISKSIKPKNSVVVLTVLTEGSILTCHRLATLS